MEKSADDQNNENKQLIFATRGPLSTADMIMCFLNSAIGIGVLKLGSVFAAGYGFAIILLILFAVLAYFSMYLFLASASIYRQSTFEEIWISAFGQKTVIIPAACSILSSLTNAIRYTHFAQKSLIVMISHVFKLISKDLSGILTQIESHSFLIGLFVIIFYYLPISFSLQLSFITRISYWCGFVSLLFALYIIIRFAFICKKHGFDPANQFTWFEVKNVPGAISSTMFAYLLYPLSYPGLRHAKVPTFEHLNKMFIITMISLFFIYTFLGSFDYFTFFGEDSNQIILDFYPKDTRTEKILIVAGTVLSLIVVSCTTPLCISAIRYVILTSIHQNSSFPADIWVFIGIGFSLISLALANMSDDIQDIFSLIGEIMGSILQYILPSLLYLRGNKMKNKVNAGLSIFFMIFGVASMFFTFYNRSSIFK